MDGKPPKMKEGTDEEGYPRQYQSVMGEPCTNPFRLRRRFRIKPASKDQESGETTNQQVVVMRRPQREALELPEINKGRIDHVLHRRLELHFSLVALRNNIPDFKYTHPTCPNGKCAAVPMKFKGGKKKLFRIPLDDPMESPQPKTSKGDKVIFVSIWKEYCFADNILEVTTMDMKSSREKCKTKCIEGKIKIVQRYISIPVIYIKFLCILMMIINCILCKVTVPLMLLCRLRKHAKIHRLCEEKGIKPVFTGSACHGPLIYSIRKFGCHLCRAQEESKLSMRLIEIMNEERRSQLVT